MVAGIERLPLSPGQARVLAFIQLFIAENQFPPTYRDIMHAMGFRGTNAVTGYLKTLERKGYIAMDGGTARSIRVLDPPETHAEKLARLERELREAEERLAAAIAEGGDV